MRALNQPVSWWGWHGWDHPRPLSVTQLVQAGSLSPRLAALLWLGLERGASLVIAADPPSSGKTTTLTALLAFLPPETEVYFTRGLGERFQLPPPSPEHPTYLLINEISDHLPVYLWGPYVQRAFQLLGEGYSLVSTMHADTVEGVIEQLREDNGVPEAQIGRLTLVVPLALARGAEGIRRRLKEVALLSSQDGTLRRTQLAAWDPQPDSFAVLPEPEAAAALAETLTLPGGQMLAELDRRSAYLERLVQLGITADRQVAEALQAFRRSSAG